MHSTLSRQASQLAPLDLRGTTQHVDWAKVSHKRSTAHQDLHCQTQAAVMDERQRACETVEKCCDGIEAKVEQILEFHEKGSTPQT